MAHTDIKEVVRGLHGCSTGRVGSTVEYRDCVERGCMQTMNNQRTISNRPRCYAKSPTAQDVFWPIAGLISCTGVTGSMQEIELICQA